MKKQKIIIALLCNLCDQSFFALRDLKRHIAAVHNGKKDFKCDICKKLFPSKFNLNRHIRDVHKKARNKEKSRIQRIQV